MRPGLVFVGLFAILMILYFAFKDSIGVLGTFLLQASLVIVILGGTVWYRFARKRRAWFFFRMEDDGEDDDGPSTGSGTSNGAADSINQPAEKVHKAG